MEAEKRIGAHRLPNQAIRANSVEHGVTFLYQLYPAYASTDAEQVRIGYAHDLVLGRYPGMSCLLDGDRLRQVARLVNIGTTLDRDMVRE